MDIRLIMVIILRYLHILKHCTNETNKLYVNHISIKTKTPEDGGSDTAWKSCHSPHFPPDFVNWATSYDDPESHRRVVTWDQWYPGKKRAKIPHSPSKTKVIPILLLSSQRVWQENGGGRGPERRQRQTFQQPVEKEKGGATEAARTAEHKENCWPGELAGTPRSCQVSSLRLWFQNVASCLSNSISIQGDKLPCSLTNSVHFLNNQHPGNNMKTSKSNQCKEGVNQSLGLPWSPWAREKWERLGLADRGRGRIQLPSVSKTSS